MQSSSETSAPFDMNLLWSKSTSTLGSSKIDASFALETVYKPVVERNVKVAIIENKCEYPITSLSMWSSLFAIWFTMSQLDCSDYSESNPAPWLVHETNPKPTDSSSDQFQKRTLVHSQKAHKTCSYETVKKTRLSVSHAK